MKKTFVYVSVLLAGFFLTIGRVWAEDEPPTITVSDLEALSDKLSDLSQYAKIGLLLQAQYIDAGYNSLVGKGFASPIRLSTVTGLTLNDLFLGRRAEISLFGDLTPKKISYLLKFDPLATTAAKAGISNGEQVKDFYAKVSAVQYFEILFGQTKYPQGLEGRQPTGDLDFVNRALVVTALNDRRDLTLQVSGSKIPLGPLNLEYAAALVQGAGQNAQDNNNAKDVAGRMGFGVAGTGLWLGTSGYSGWETTVSNYSGPRSFIGLEGRWTYRSFNLQGELLQGQLEPGNNYNPWDGTKASTAFVSNPQGFYLLASYRLNDFRLGVRGESYNQDSTAGSKYNVRNDVLTVGLDWFQAHDKFRIYLDFEEHFLQYEAVLAQVEIYI